MAYPNYFLIHNPSIQEWQQYGVGKEDTGVLEIGT
jgi:hypothetical protein